LALSTSFIAGNSGSTTHVAYLGFDRNDYPGDSSLKLLRGKFSFAGFWLNNPPGANSNSWTGKRRVVQELGFGFLVVFNGRTFAQIKEAADATKLGASDGVMAVSSARHEGFPAGTISIDYQPTKSPAISLSKTLTVNMRFGGLDTSTAVPQGETWWTAVGPQLPAPACTVDAPHDIPGALDGATDIANDIISGCH
jgi:hypothetical protein